MRTLSRMNPCLAQGCREFVAESPLGHIKKTLTSTFVCALSCLSAKLQLSVVGVHFPLGHAH